MARAKISWLLPGLMCLALWPAGAHAQSPDLMDAFYRNLELYSEGATKRRFRSPRKL